MATKTMAQTCAGWFVALPVTCGIGARGRRHPTQDRRPDEAGLSARFASLRQAWCGTGSLRSAAGQPRDRNQRHQKEFLQVSNEETPTTEQPRAQALAMRAGGRKKAAAKKKAGRKAAPKKAATQDRRRRRRPRAARRPHAKKAGRKTAERRRRPPRRKARSQEGSGSKEGRRTQEGRCCRGSCSRTRCRRAARSP